MKLVEPTGEKRTDAMLSGFLELFTAAFPDRLRGCYLTGSHAVGAARAGSDLDLFVVARGDLGLAEAQRMRQFAQACSRLAPVDLDLGVLGEDEALRFGEPALKRKTLLLWGEDQRELLPWPTVEHMTRRTLHRAFYPLAAVRRLARLEFPLGPPDPTAELLGYDRLPRRTADGGSSPSLKGLSECCGKPALALTVLAKGEVDVTRRRQVELAREVVGERWGEHVELVDRYCVGRWHDEVPEDSTDRELARRLCAATVGFENHFLERYRDFLLAELTTGANAGGAGEWLTLSQAARLLGLDPALLTELRDAELLATRRENGCEQLRIEDVHAVLAAAALSRLYYDDARFPALLSRRAAGENPLLKRLAQAAIDQLTRASSTRKPP